MCVCARARACVCDVCAHACTSAVWDTDLYGMTLSHLVQLFLRFSSILSLYDPIICFYFLAIHIFLFSLSYDLDGFFATKLNKIIDG